MGEGVGFGDHPQRDPECFAGWDRGGMVVWPKEVEGGLLQ